MDLAGLHLQVQTVESAGPAEVLDQPDYRDRGCHTYKLQKFYVIVNVMTDTDRWSL
jgi:hypothetical protein